MLVSHSNPWLEQACSALSSFRMISKVLDLCLNRMRTSQLCFSGRLGHAGGGQAQRALRMGQLTFLALQLCGMALLR